MEQNFPEKFSEIPKAVEYPKCEPFNQKLKKFGERSYWKENFRVNFSKIWVYLARLSSFLKILKNAVPFATGSCRKFKPDILLSRERPICMGFCFDPATFKSVSVVGSLDIKCCVLILRHRICSFHSKIYCKRKLLKLVLVTFLY